MVNWEDYYYDPKVIQLNDVQHALAAIAKLPIIRNADGKVSAKLSITEWPNHISNNVLSGMMKALKNPSRSEVFKARQTDPAAVRYSGLVPLVLSAFKQYRGIGYSEWDWTDSYIKYLLDDRFIEVIPYIIGEKACPDFSTKELAEFQATLSDAKPLTSYWQITAKDLPELEGYPRLLKVMLLQVWVAQPHLRTDLMILDCKSLDTMPEPISGGVEIFTDDPFRLPAREFQPEKPTKNSIKKSRTAEQERMDAEIQKLWMD